MFMRTEAATYAFGETTISCSLLIVNTVLKNHDAINLCTNELLKQMNKFGADVNEFSDVFSKDSLSLVKQFFVKFNIFSRS